MVIWVSWDWECRVWSYGAGCGVHILNDFFLFLGAWGVVFG